MVSDIRKTAAMPRKSGIAPEEQVRVIAIRPGWAKEPVCLIFFKSPQSVTAGDPTANNPLRALCRITAAPPGAGLPAAYTFLLTPVSFDKISPTTTQSDN
jgi:hypothetical protein